MFSLVLVCVFFFFKQKTAYEMRISDWSSDVCSSDLTLVAGHLDRIAELAAAARACAESQPAALQRRLREQVTALVESEPRLSDERLAQEVALLVAKADSREEIERLDAHVEAARTLLSSARPVGRGPYFLVPAVTRGPIIPCPKARAL